MNVGNRLRRLERGGAIDAPAGSRLLSIQLEGEINGLMFPGPVSGARNLMVCHSTRDR
jgi:hypothetical protein